MLANKKTTYAAQIAPVPARDMWERRAFLLFAFLRPVDVELWVLLDGINERGTSKWVDAPDAGDLRVRTSESGH